MGLTISGRGLVLRGTLAPDEFGFLVKEDGLQGWESLPAGRREALARAVAHGEHDVPVRLPARVVTVEGVAIAESEGHLRRMCQRITGWGATGDRFGLAVDLQGQVLHATVRSILRETSDSGHRGGFCMAPFQVQLLAADPRKYGETHTYPTAGTGTSLSVLHRGNFPAHPVIEIPAAPTSYTLTSPAGMFTVTGATSGGTHRVDTRTGRVTRDGVWMQGVGRGRLWAVPDGAVWTHTLSVPGRVLITDTYV